MDEKDILINQLQEEIQRLNQQLEKITLEKEKLDEECDILAEDNERMRMELLKYESPSRDTGVSNEPQENETLFKKEAPIKGASSVQLEVFVEGQENYVNKQLKQFPNAASGKNAICTAFFHSTEIGQVIFCGGVDATIHGYDPLTGIELYSFKSTAPVLTLDCHGSCVAAGSMDGSLLVSYITSVESNPRIVSFKDHTKYVIALKWSLDGSYLATAGHDKTVNIYKRSEENELMKIKSIQFNHTPESLIFTIPSVSLSTVEPELIIGLRGLPYLIYYNLISDEQREISMNENDWDHHVSFAPLYLSISPNNKYLLIATDKNMHIIVKLGTNVRVRTLTGHASGDYGKPVAVWDPSGCYVYCNSEEENTLYVYSVARERVIQKLHGHTGIIRGLAVDAVRGLVATASYDKSVILWERQI